MISNPSGHLISKKPYERHYIHHNKNGTTPNKKRSRITENQTLTLEASFASNPLPQSSIRHELSLSLGIPERTIRIWFQNRRAKTRRLEKQSGGDNDRSSDANIPLLTSTQPYRYQSLLTPQLFEEMHATTFGTAGQQTSLSKTSTSESDPNPENTKSKTSTSEYDTNPENTESSQAILEPWVRSAEINHLQRLQNSTFGQSDGLLLPDLPLPVHLLRIGTWMRLANTGGYSTWDLLCYYTTNYLVWQIQDEGLQFRIQVPVTAIHQMSFGSTENNMDACFAQLKIQLDPQQLIFTMCLDKHHWVLCDDFTEQKQASQLFTHEIQGYLGLLQQALIDLLSIVPGLAVKLVLVASPTLSDLCPNLTLSPSATPEPFCSSVVHGTSSHITSLDKPMLLHIPLYMDSLSSSYQDGASHWY